MTTVDFAAGGRIELEAPKGRNVFLYVARGDIRAGGTSVPHFHLAEVEDEGERILIESPDESLILFGHADPIGEPVVAHGPFVMNTREEIFEAVRDYQAGRFRGVIEL